MRLTRQVPPDEWNAFVERHGSGWFWHRRDWIAYQLAYRSTATDESFAVVDDDGKLVAVVPVIFSHPHDRPTELSYAGDPLAAPLLSSPTRVLRQLIRDEVMVIARRVGAYQLVTAPTPFELWGMTMPGCSVTQRIVDLGALAWNGVRKSYRSLIHAGQRAYTISAWRGDGAADAYAEYQTLHRTLAGQPRADATYRWQRRWLDDGLAAVVTARSGSVTWGAAYWYVWKGLAYYGSGAYAARDVAHAVVWESLGYLRACGIRFASLGWQGTARNDKEQAIEFFKRGFGGYDVPCPVTVEGF